MPADSFLKTVAAMVTTVSLQFVCASMSLAAELEEGFVIDASNYQWTCIP